MESAKEISEEDEMEDQIAETCPSGRYVRFEDKLGAGAFKTVYRALDTELGIEVAWNRIGLERFQLDRSKVLREISFFQRIRHHNVIEFYDFWMDENQVVFITELMPSGTLKEYITKSPEVKVKIIKGWCKQILTGLNYLHTRDPPIIHRDIKCDNIFINGTSSEGEVKIGDLGLATLSLRKEHLSVIGTPEFMAPEYYNENYSTTVDIWAFGMAIIEMVTLECPYAECDNVGQIFKKVTAGVLPKQLDAIEDREVREFVELCLADESSRPSAAELLEHPFFSLDEQPSLNSNSISSTNNSNSTTNLTSTNSMNLNNSYSNHQPSSYPNLSSNLHTSPPNLHSHSHSHGNSNPNSSPTNPGTNGISQQALSPPLNRMENGKTTSNPTPPMSPPQDRQHGRTPSFSDPQVILVENGEPINDVIEMKLLLDISGEHTEIKFEYNLITDTAENVAKEMVNDLQLHGAQDNICGLIQKQVDSFQKLHPPKPLQSDSSSQVNQTEENLSTTTPNATLNGTGTSTSDPVDSRSSSTASTTASTTTPTSTSIPRESTSSGQSTSTEHDSPVSSRHSISNQPSSATNIQPPTNENHNSSQRSTSVAALSQTKGTPNELANSVSSDLRISNSMDSAGPSFIPGTSFPVMNLEFLTDSGGLDSTLDSISPSLFTIPPLVGTVNDMADLEDLLDEDSDAEYDRLEVTSDSPIGWSGDPSESEDAIPMGLMDSSIDPYGSSSTDDDEQELIALKRKHEQALRDLLELQKNEVRQLSERHQQRRMIRASFDSGSTVMQESTKALQEYYKVSNGRPAAGNSSNGSTDPFATASEI